MVKMKDAPAMYNSDEASAWLCGYGAGSLAALRDVREIALQAERDDAFPIWIREQIDALIKREEEG